VGWAYRSHLNLGVAQERRQRHKVNARLCRPRLPGVAKIVQPEPGHLAIPHSPVMGVVHLGQVSRVPAHLSTVEKRLSAEVDGICVEERGANAPAWGG